MTVLGLAKTGGHAARDDAVDRTLAHPGDMTVGGPGEDDGRRAYLIQDLPEDLAELLRTQKTPEDLPDYP